MASIRERAATPSATFDLRRRGSMCGRGAKDIFLSVIEPVLGVLRIELLVGVSREVEVDAESEDSADAESDDREDSVRRLSTGASTAGATTTVAMQEDEGEARW